MPSHPLKFAFITVAFCLTGCAAMITNSEPDEAALLQVGTTAAELAKRLGTPLSSVDVVPRIQAVELWERDREVSLLLPRESATTMADYAFKGRLDKQRRVGQAGFDSFMTLGLAEIVLIPKALWERVSQQELQLSVWFDANGRAVAYKWSELPPAQSGKAAKPNLTLKQSANDGPSSPISSNLSPQKPTL